MRAEAESGQLTSNVFTLMLSFAVICKSHEHKQDTGIFQPVVCASMCRFQVQYKLQRRLLRASHPHEHWGNAFLKYMRSFAVKHRECCVFFSADDKARVALGEPGCPAQTGVRNRPQLALAEDELVAG